MHHLYNYKQMRKCGWNDPAVLDGVNHVTLAHSSVQCPPLISARLVNMRPFLHPESLQIFRFTASSLQFTHSSSTGFRSENTWHEIRDHSFIQNHSRSSDSQLLLFSSLTHLLQGSDQRTPDTRSETIPSSRITPDLQIHSFFSSVHSLIFYRVQIREHLTRDQRPFLHPESLQIFRFTASPLQFTSLIFYRVQIREHLTRDQRPFLHPESLQIFRFTASPLQFTHSSSTGFRSENTWHEIRDHSFIQNHSRPFRFTASPLQFTSLIFYRVQVREHLTRDQRSFLHPESLQILQIHSFFSSVHSLIFYRVQVREHLTRDQRPFLHPESLQIFRFTASPLQFTSLIFYRVQVREHLTRDQRPFLHPESLQIFRFTASSLQFTRLLQGSDQRTPDTRSETIPSSRITPDLQIHSFSSSVHSLIFYRVQVREHLTRDQRPFLHPESLQIFRFTASPLQFTSLIFYRVQIREHLTRDQRPFLHPESLQIFRFTASPLQFTSLIFYRVQVREHLTRDQRPFLHPESLQILQIHSFFSSVHLTHLLQGSDQRTPDTRSETIPSSRITPDLQIHSFSSSVHSLIFYRVQIREHLTQDQRPFLHPESLQIFRFTASSLQFTSLIFYRVQVREHLTRDQRPFLHPESLQIFRFTASSLQFTHSSSTGFRSENTWHEIRDHSFIQNHSRSSDSQLLLFSSPHSSSTGFRSENTWHEIRDHSFIQNHSRSSDSQLLLFSSLTHLLQGSGQRTPDTRSETIPSSRITPDLQIHSFSSSVHSLIFYRVQIREHLTRDQRPFLHPESLQIFRLTASSLQFTHSSSTGFRSENTWHEIRDHSFIQNHSRSSDSQLLLFSSLTHLLQGSDQRTPDTRSETIPSSRITPDLQIHSISSSVHSLIFYRVQIREHLTRDQRPFLHPESLQIFRFTASSLQFTSLIFYRVQVREHLTRDQRPFLHPESLQIFRFTASPLQFTSLIFYRVQVREHLTRDQRPFLHPESLQIFRFTASPLQFTSLIFYRVQVREHLTRDQRPFLHPESLQIFRFTASPLQFTSLIFYRVQVREHLTRDQRPFLHPESLQIFRFTASSLQFTHSSSTGFRSENTWHEIRDHSFIQNHSRPFRFTASPLQFTSLIFYRVQVREHLTRDQRSFLHPESLQILQIHSFFSSVHSLIFYRVQVREHLTRDQRPFLHPESLQIFRFTASSLQFTHSSSTGFRSENTWHEIRDHSFIQNHSRSSDSQLLLFSSLTHLLQGSGQRTGMETRSLVLCSVTHFGVVFEVCVWIIVRLDPNMAHYKISNRVSHVLILYLLVFDRIHDAMCLNKMSRTSSRNIDPQH